MKTTQRRTLAYSLICMTVFIWIGFVCSISFMEAWIKFRAPNVSLSIGLSIGKLVFSALNKMEWALLGVIAFAFFLSHPKSKFTKSVFLYIPIIILVLQTSWLLPSLHERAEQIIQGNTATSSSIHFYYVFLECIKILSLFALGIYTLRLLLDEKLRHDSKSPL